MVENSFHHNVILSLPKEESKEAREERLVIIPRICSLKQASTMAAPAQPDNISYFDSFFLLQCHPETWDNNII